MSWLGLSSLRTVRMLYWANSGRSFARWSLNSYPCRGARLWGTTRYNLFACPQDTGIRCQARAHDCWTSITVIIKDSYPRDLPRYDVLGHPKQRKNIQYTRLRAHIFELEIGITLNNRFVASRHRPQRGKHFHQYHIHDYLSWWFLWTLNEPTRWLVWHLNPYTLPSAIEGVSRMRWTDAATLQWLYAHHWPPKLSLISDHV